MMNEIIVLVAVVVHVCLCWAAAILLTIIRKMNCYCFVLSSLLPKFQCRIHNLNIDDDLESRLCSSMFPEGVALLHLQGLSNHSFHEAFDVG